jgi:hypothetical protein
MATTQGYCIKIDAPRRSVTHEKGFIRDFPGLQFDFRPEGPQQTSLGQSEVRW